MSASNGLAGRLRSWWSDGYFTVWEPVTLGDLLQIVKTVVAAAAALTISVQFGSTLPFLAPWAALLTVHATVFRTLSRGTQAITATVLGVLLSFAAGVLLGFGLAGFCAVLLAGLLAARLRLIRDEGVTIATTALFVMTTAYVQQDPALLERVVDTAVGVGIGLLVNIVVVPPLNNHSARRRVDDINRRLGGLLQEMSAELGTEWDEDRAAEWISRTRDIDRELEHTWEVVRYARESSRWNPRYRLSRRASDPAGYQDILDRLEDGVAQTQSMARTIQESTSSAHEWDPRFRDPWLDLLDEVGRRVADPEAEVHGLHDRVDELTRELSSEDLPGLLWPIYGALISNLINIIDVVDDVASAQEART